MAALSFNSILRRLSAAAYSGKDSCSDISDGASCESNAIACSECVPSRTESICTGQQFYASVLFLKSWFESRAEFSGVTSAVVFLSNSLHFAVAFVALAALGKKIVLPHNSSYGALTLLLNEYDCLVADNGVFNTLAGTDFRGVNVEEQLAQLDVHSSQQRRMPLLSNAPITVDEEKVEVVVYTSGSTGQPKAIAKPLRCYTREVNFIDQHWGQLLGDFRIVASVSHQHVYGLLFRFLWPLLSGRVFCSRLLQFPEELGSDGTPYVLISSPAYLSRLKKHGVVQHEVGPVKVFSSGGPLDQEDRFTLQAMLDTRVVEVFGSSETGGVAYRERVHSEDSLAWQPMTPVTVAQATDSQCLRVKSPFIGEAHWFEMADRVQLLADGRFKLLGRVDSIVKIEEKRISLTEIEQLVLNSDWVNHCQLVVLHGARTQLGAVVQLSDAGSQLLAEKGKFFVTQELRGFLACHLERVVVPRKWRFVTSLPYNTQGKLTQQDLVALFAT